MNKIKLHDVVVLLHHLPQEKLQKGSIGTVVDTLDGTMLLVEFADADGVAYAMVEIPAELLVKVVRERMAMAA